MSYTHFSDQNNKKIETYIGKREIQKYDPTIDKKSFYIQGVSSYFFINYNEMEKPIKESFFFSDICVYSYKLTSKNCFTCIQ